MSNFKIAREENGSLYIIKQVKAGILPNALKGKYTDSHRAQMILDGYLHQKEALAKAKEELAKAKQLEAEEKKALAEAVKETKTKSKK